MTVSSRMSALQYPPTSLMMSKISRRPILVIIFSLFLIGIMGVHSSNSNSGKHLGQTSSDDVKEEKLQSCWWNCSYSAETPQCCSFCGPGGEAVEGCCTHDSDCTSHGDSAGAAYCRKDTNWCDGCSAGFGGPLCQYAWATEPRDKCTLANGTIVTCPVERPYCDGKIGACYGESLCLFAIHLLPSTIQYTAM